MINGFDPCGSAASSTLARPSYAGPDARDMLAVGALLATFVAVVGLFAVSPIALEAGGIPYIETGGGFFSKFHPATSIIFAAFVMRCLAARRPVHLAWRLLTDDTGVLLMLAAVVVAAIFAALVDKTPITPLVDTFILPVLVFVLLRDLDRSAATWLAALVALVLLANAGLAVVELLKGFHLIHAEAPQDATDDPTKANLMFSWQANLAHDWRAEALLGHPLVNGVVVGGIVICLAAPGAAWVPLVPRVCLLMTQALSLFCFGARTALVVSFLLSAWLIAQQAVAAIGRGARLTPRRVAPAALAVGLLVIVSSILVYSGLLDRTLDRFSNDAGSATTRVTMFQLFAPISLTDLVLHPDKDLVATLQRVYGLEFGIESSWIGLVLTYGLIVAAMIAAGFLAFWRSILRVAGAGGFVVFLFNLIIVSVTASLSGKTTTLAMAVALVVLFLRRDTTADLRRGAFVKSNVHDNA